MRLIHLADYGGPYAGSFIPMLRAACAAGRREGWDVGVVLSDVARDRPWLRTLADDGIPVHFAPAGSGPRAQAAIRALLAESAEPTILHSHFSSFDVPMVRAARGRRHTTLYWQIHSHLSGDLRVRLRNTARFLVYGPRVQEILCVAPHLVREVRTRLAPRSRVHHLANAIDTTEFPLASAHERAAAREQLGLPPAARVVLHLGWHWQLKGGDLFLDVVERLAHRDDIVFLSLGGGEVAAAEIAARGLEDRVRQLEPVANASHIYAAASVLISPSRREGMPFSMIEALSRGTAVVASAIPGQLYVGRDLGACRFTGLDADELAAAVEATLARDAPTVDEDARAAHEWIASSMDIEVWAERLIARYRRRAGA